MEAEVNVFYPELREHDSSFNLLTNQLRRLQVSDGCRGIQLHGMRIEVLLLPLHLSFMSHSPLLFPLLHSLLLPCCSRTRAGWKSLLVQGYQRMLKARTRVNTRGFLRRDEVISAPCRVFRPVFYPCQGSKALISLTFPWGRYLINFTIPWGWYLKLCGLLIFRCVSIFIWSAAAWMISKVLNLSIGRSSFSVLKSEYFLRQSG